MSERLQLIEAQRAVEAEQQAIGGVLITLQVGGRQVLFIRLGADGGIHRLGSGSLETVERDRFIGTTASDVFTRISQKITPELLAWCGQARSHPAPRGEVCELVIAFQRADGQEEMMAWRYGFLSKWPPSEILEFVGAAVDATCPWYEDQKRQMRLRTERTEYGWWHFFGLPHS